MTLPRRIANSPFAPAVVPTSPDYQVGDRVSHDSHGLGRVVSTSGTSAVTVDFGSHTLHLSLPCKALDLL